MEINNLDKIIEYVNTGEIRSGGNDTILNSGAIGSCIVITAFDSDNKIGAMAHIMLPGKHHQNSTTNSLRFAEAAVEELFCQLEKKGSLKDNLEICVVGGANVLKRINDTIGKDNWESVENLLKENHLEIKAKSIGGLERRTVVFDISKGCVNYTVGDSKQEILWQTKENR